MFRLQALLLILLLIRVAPGNAQTLELGAGSAGEDRQVEIPLLLTAPDPVEGVSAVFDWYSAKLEGVDLQVDPTLASADFVQTVVRADWMAVGIVCSFELEETLGPGSDLPLAMAVLECKAGVGTPGIPVQFEDAVHRTSVGSPALRNGVTVNADLVDQSSGLTLLSGACDCSYPPEICDDSADNDADGLVDCDDPDCSDECVISTDASFVIEPLDPGATRGPTSDGVTDWVVGAPAGRARSGVELGVFLESGFEGTTDGVQGWSVSVELESCFQIDSATIQGTAAADVTDDPPGLRDGGFFVVDVVDPNLPENNGRRGVVSAVVLSNLSAFTLPPQGKELILRVQGSMDSSELRELGDRMGTPCAASPLGEASWLAGEGEPVESVVSWRSTSLRPSVVGASITLKADLLSFVRGDADQTGEINITDGIFILNFLFLGGSSGPGCRDAADSNDDGLLDLSDAITLFGWLFLGAQAPPAPSPSAPGYAPGDCGPDPTADNLDCGESVCG